MRTLLKHSQLPHGKSKSQVKRLEDAGDHPRAVKDGSENAWVESEINARTEFQIAKRDNPDIAEKLTAWHRKEMEAGRNPWTTEQLKEKVDEFLGKKAKR